MRTVFADAFYWIASINPGDNWYPLVKSVAATLDQSHIVTTDEVLTEVLAFYSTSGIQTRRRAGETVKSILKNPRISVIPQTHDSFLIGFSLYESRPDKGYSLTDCISMNTMQQLEISEVLTHDKHFAQEGFVILFPD